MAGIRPFAMTTARAIFTFVILIVAATGASAYKDDKGTAVDQGTFGVFIDGKRVATETFSIRQMPDYNVSYSEIKLAESKTHQTADLRLKSNGDLLRYEWKGLQPQKATAVVEPNQGFLNQKTTGPDGKTAEHPYLLPPSSAILDDFFFSQREVLLWKYMAANCRAQNGKPGCELQPAQFGVVIPRQQASAMITIGYDGRDRVNIKGSDQELDRFIIKTDGPQWTVWADDSHKIVRITIPESNTEVVRD